MPNRAPSELLWDAPAPSGNRGGGLTREAIVAAAMAVADAEGLDAVSIRRVAGDLGVRPMSLYTHIASKDNLLELMVNEVVAEALVPEPLPEDWRAAVREIAVRSHDAFLAHPWTLQAFSQRPHVGPNTLRHAEQSTAAVAGLGLDPRTAATLLAVVDDYALGHAMRAMFTPHEAKMREMVAEMLRAADPSEFPHLTAGPLAVPLDDSFEIGLDALLEGLERTLLAR